MIYFAQTPTGSIKIGCTRNLYARLNNLASCYGRPVTLLATMLGDRKRETEIHERFSHLRFGRTEQFRPGPDLMAFIGKPLLVGANPDAVEEQPSRHLGVTVIKLPTDVVDHARVVAALRGVPMTDMLGDFLRPFLSKWESEEIDKRVAGRAAEPPAKRKGGSKS